MKLLFIFLDGVGLGINDPEINPFARARMPQMRKLLDGRGLVTESAPFESQRVSLLALDACLGVDGIPQSATGQATLLTGKNIPNLIGYHYGPKPNPPIAEFLCNGNFFTILGRSNRKCALLNAYPPRYFEGIRTGRRMYSAIPLAVTSAGFPLKTIDDLYKHQALSADFTGKGWREHLGISDAPLLEPYQAGVDLSHLANQFDLSLFEYWLTDYAGHHRNMEDAVSVLETFDRVIAGLLASWDYTDSLILITSDHGNLEDLSTRRHTRNPVPAVLIGSAEHCGQFISGLHDLSGIAPAILGFLI